MSIPDKFGRKTKQRKNALKPAELPWEQILSDWSSERESIKERAEAECERNKEQLTQIVLEYLNTQHPLLRDNFLCRMGLSQSCGLQKEAENLALNGYGLPLEQLTCEIEKVIEYFWAIENIRYADEVIRSRSSAAEAQRKNKEKAMLQKQEFEKNITPTQAELVDKYLKDIKEITGKYCLFNVRRVEHEWREAVQMRLIDEFWNKYGENAKYMAGYAIAKENRKDEFLPKPFECLEYMGPSWEDGGITFRIERRCFADSDPILYYKDDAGWSDISWECFLRLSSGLTDVRRCDSDNTVILFRLSEENVNKTFLNRGEVLLTEKLGEYLFVRAGSRDFHCEFGEIKDGERIPLSSFII